MTWYQIEALAHHGHLARGQVNMDCGRVVGSRVARRLALPAGQRPASGRICPGCDDPAGGAR